MTRAPCCEKSEVKKGPWTPEEDDLLVRCIEKHGEGNWSSVPKKAGLIRCGKSCRLRWANYLRPDLKRGTFTPEEEDLIIALHKEMGNRWAKIALELPGRTDNDIKNHWNTRIKRRLRDQGICPETHKPLPPSEGPKQKPGTRKRHAAAEAAARKRTVVTPEVGPITLLHMPSEEEILHKFGLAMQAYWQAQANPGCADHGTGSLAMGCLSPTGLPHVFFDPTGGFGPATSGHGGCTAASAQAAAAEAAAAAAELLCSSLRPRLAAKVAPSSAPAPPAAANPAGGGAPEVCHNACCRSNGGYPQLTPASPSKGHGECDSGGEGGLGEGGATAALKAEGLSQGAASQRCMHGAPAGDEESVGESREVCRPGTPGETTPGKLPAGLMTSAMLEDSHHHHQGSFCSLSGSPTSTLHPGSPSSPPLSGHASSGHAISAGAHSHCHVDAPGAPQEGPAASAGLRRSFHSCAESLQALGRGPTSGVPVVQPGFFMQPQGCVEEQEGVRGAEGRREMHPRGSCTGARPAHRGVAAGAAIADAGAAGAGVDEMLSLAEQGPAAGNASDSESGVADYGAPGGSTYAGLQLQIPSKGHASPFLLHQSSDASEEDLWTPGGESGDLWSSDEDIDMAAMVLISPTGPGASHFKSLSSLLSPACPKSVPASVPLASSGNNSASGSGSESGNSGVADDMNCFNNLGDIALGELGV